MFDLSLPEPVQIALVLALIVAVFAGFVRERIPSDVVALLAMAALLILGLLSVDDALDVFSNAAPITIGAMFVLSAALERTGVIGAVGNSVVRLSKTWSPFAAIAVLMLVVIVLSAFMNNTPIVVILIPVASAWVRSRGSGPWSGQLVRSGDGSGQAMGPSCGQVRWSGQVPGQVISGTILGYL